MTTREAGTTSNVAAYSALLEVGPTSSSRERLAWIDGARGFSIVAMIVSHIGLISGLTPWWFHQVVMRPVAPVFLMLFAMLWRPGWRRRHWQLLASATAASGMAAYLGFATPNILLVLLGAVIIMPAIERWPLAVAALGATQLVFWPLPEWWTGYPVGFVLVLLVAGRHAPVDGFLSGYGRLGLALGCERIGQQPLRWYLGHLLALVLLVAALS